MEATFTVGILVFLVAVMIVVLLGPGGDGLRRESSLPKSFASRPLTDAVPAHALHVVNPRPDTTNHHSGMDHSAPATGLAKDLAVWGESRPELDPAESHHINNFTL